MANNFFNQARELEQTPFAIESGIKRRMESFEANRPPLNLKTPNDFRKGFFNKPDLSDIQAGFAFKEAIESGDQAVVQQFIDAGMFENLDETATQKAVEMIQNVKDIQSKFTPMGIKRMGGIRMILKSGLPGEEKTRSLQTPKGAVEKTVKGPTIDDLVIRERMAAGDSMLEATRALARAKKAEPLGGKVEEEKRPLFETEERKKPTKAGVLGKIFEKMASGEELSSGEQSVLQTTQKKGFHVTTKPDGTTVVEFGGTGVQEPTRPFKTQIQKETFSAQKGLGELIALKEKITPESFGITASIQKGMQEVFEFISPGSTPKGIAKPAADRDKLFRQGEETFALRVKQLTGVQFGEKEATRLKKSFPNADDNFAEFNNKIDDLIDAHLRSIARLKRFNNPTDRNVINSIVNSVPLGTITKEEIEDVRKEFGLSEDAAGTDESKDLSGLSDEEILRRIGVQ
jgi:hypothetical protein